MLVVKRHCHMLRFFFLKILEVGVEGVDDFFLAMQEEYHYWYSNSYCPEGNPN